MERMTGFSLSICDRTRVRIAPGLLSFRDDSPVQICDFGSFGIRPGLPALLKKIERFFDPWRQDANRLEDSDHSSNHIDQIALLIA